MPPKKNKMPAVLQQEAPRTAHQHCINPDATIAMDIDYQAQNETYNPVPGTPPDPEEVHPQPQPQEHVYMTAKGFTSPTSDSISGHQQSHSQPQQEDTRDEIIRDLRALREEVEALRRAKQPKRTSGGNSQLIQQSVILLAIHCEERMIQQEEQRIQQEEEMLHQLAKTHWRETRRLQGRENYAEWRKNLLIDADFINARDVLLHPNRVPKNTPVQSAHHDTSARLLHTRILDRLMLDVLYQVHTDHTQHPHDILSRLDTIYGVSPAEERLLLVKTLMNLKPNGDTVSMMRQWQRITSEIVQKYDASELCHDIGIVLLGDFQRSFVRTQLDNLFAGSKRDRFHEMDMDDIIDQIESRTPPAPHTYRPLSYTIYRQDPWNPNHFTTGPANRGTHKGGSSQPNCLVPNTSGESSSPNKRSPVCSHCKRGPHSLDDCWTLHPEKRPPPKSDNLNPTMRQPDGYTNLVQSAASAYGWVLDTGATWTTYNDRSAFVNYMPFTVHTTAGLPDGSQHRVEGVGTICLPIGEHMVELKNVRYIPTLKTRLLSFNQLEKQGFHISTHHE